MGAAFTFVTFWSLVAFVASAPERRARLAGKSAREWALDLTGLTVQGIVIPIVGVAALTSLYKRLAPSLEGSLHLPWLASFALAFVAVDYAYYWNHRLLHTPALWPLHAVHHSARHMDVFVTSRNTLWTSALIVYLWASSSFVFALSDASGYLAGAALTAMLDLARHSPLDLSRFPRLERALGAFLVLPRDHALHHADSPEHGNYAANFVLWDKLHGTYLGRREAPPELGSETNLSFFRSLVYPRRRA